MFEEITFNREDLYEEVWSVPMSSLAKKYSLSDVGLAKICKKLKIPVPGRGYWAKGVLNKLPLPPLKYGEVSTHTLHREKREILPIDEEHENSVQALILFEEDPKNKIQVYERLTSPHPIIEKTLNTLKEAKADLYGRLFLLADKCFNVSITRNSISKAMRILDALLKGLDKRGFCLSLSSDPYNPHRNRNLSHVTVLKQKIEISLDEPVKKVDRVLTPAEEKDRLKHPWKYHEKSVYVPSGELALRINNVHWGEIRRTWSDGKKVRLQDCLNDFMIGLIRASGVLRSVKLKREIEKREWEEQERERVEKERKVQEEQERFRTFMMDVENWHKSIKIRAYIDAVREKAIRGQGAIAPGSQIEKWLAWATQEAEKIDPLNKNTDPLPGTQAQVV